MRITREGKGVAHYDGDPFITDEVIEVKIHHKGFKVVINANKPEQEPGLQLPIKNLLQLVPDFFNEWRRVPETLINKTGRDLKKWNKNLIDKIKGKN